MVHLRVLLIVTCVSSAWPRDVGKNYKTLPAVTNSLINLGKMDILFNFHMHPEDALRSDHMDHGSDTLIHPRKENSLEACPCSSIRYIKDSSKSHPSSLLNRILSGNELFSFKDPTSSPLCCNSHEHTQEDIILEFGPKQNHVVDNSQNFGNSFTFLPHLLDVLQNRPSLPIMPMNPKTVEILFFPKKTDISPKNIGKLKEKKNMIMKKNIVVVGNNEIKNEFKSGAFVPPLPSSTTKNEENFKKLSKNEGQEKATIDDKKNVI